MTMATRMGKDDAVPRASERAATGKPRHANQNEKAKAGNKAREVRDPSAALLSRAGSDAVEQADGRRRRTETTRAKIVAALMKLVGEGDVSPSAASVAETADVDLRTVFRHFREVDLLYREITESIRSRVLPEFFRPREGGHWTEGLHELIDLRIDIYESLLPYKIASDLRRYQSEYLAEDHRYHLRLERRSLEGILPDEVKADAVLMHALRAAIGFSAWRTLRRDQDASVVEATAVFHRSVDALLARIPDGAPKVGSRPGSKRAPAVRRTAKT